MIIDSSSQQSTKTSFQKFEVEIQPTNIESESSIRDKSSQMIREKIYCVMIYWKADH